jgi:glycosyltransferase involved in cell wall biosynthesis
MSILEAFAYGKPVIGSKIGGIPEMVIDGKTGLLFNPKDDNELKEKIGYLLSHSSLITEMGRNGRERVEKNYNADIHYERLMNLYKKAYS